MASPRLIDWHKVMRLELAKAELSTPVDDRRQGTQNQLVLLRHVDGIRGIPCDDDPAEPEKVRVVSYLNPVETGVCRLSIKHATRSKEP